MLNAWLQVHVINFRIIIIKSSQLYKIHKASIPQGDHSFSKMIFHDFSMTKKMNFHDLSAQHIFFEINDTRFMNAYQNKNIFPVARQSDSK